MSGKEEKRIRSRFMWKVSGITPEKLEQSSFRLYSNPITVMFGNNVTEWRAVIQQGYEGNLKAAIYKSKVLNDNFHLSMSIGLRNIKCKYEKVKASKIEGNLGWNSFITHEMLFDPNLTFINDTEIELLYDLEFFYLTDKKEDPKKTFSKLYNDPCLADFTLISSDEKEFTVHRAFLANASDFFYKMFTIEMREKKNGSAKFEDIESTVLKEVLNYVYNGRADIEDVQEAGDLIYAAEKFNLPGLKAICSDELKKMICLKNVIGIFVVADMFCMKELEDLCAEMIVDEAREMRNNEDWDLMTPALLKKIKAKFDEHEKIPYLFTSI